MNIGIDHGYYAIKTRHFSFPAGISEYSHEPYTLQNTLEFGGKFFVCGTGRQPILRNKMENDNYYLLTLAAIAKEIKQRGGTTECSVKLAAGLPLAGFGREKKPFREYLLRSSQLADGLRPVCFKFEGIPYKITIEDVKLFPQGYSAIALHPELIQNEPSVLLMDIGGWTVDLMRLDNGVPNASTCRSLELGMIRCIDETKEQIRRDTGLSVTDAQVERILAGKPCSTLLQNRIALCDAGVGIGKTYAYLTACILLKQYDHSGPAGFQPVVVSTSSVALQDAVIGEYIPFLSRIFLENHIIQKPIRAMIRKGKERFVCDARLSQRLAAVQEKQKNAGQRKALFSLRTYYDLDAVTGLSGFDRRQVCVPKVCPRECLLRNTCRYHQYLKGTRSAEIFVQICNHNYLLADAAHRLQEMRPLLNDYRALVIDEAHKLPDAARQMYGQSLSAEDFSELCTLLEKEKYILAAQRLKEKFTALMGAMYRGELLEEAQRTAFVLTADREAALRDCLSLLRQTQKQLAPHLPRWITYRLGTTEQALNLFYTCDKRYILYIQYSRDGSPSLCAASREMPEQLRRALWLKGIPAILTSGTLMAGGSFDRTRQLMGLSANKRLDDFIAVSPFNYRENCLLYIPDGLPRTQMGSEKEAKCLAEQICRLVEATHGHTLVLFTSYSLMGAVYNQVKDRLSFPLMEVWRHSQEVIHQFKQAQNAVLFAAGSCWEGVDFPGDMVSSLIIVRLPFPVPDPLSEAEREQYPTLQDYIRAVIIPDMQVKLRQGFGRAIRTETDTCVVSILDHRAAPEKRYHRAVLETLPPLRITRKIEDVEAFIRAKKSPDYFMP